MSIVVPIIARQVYDVRVGGVSYSEEVQAILDLFPDWSDTYKNAVATFIDDQNEFYNNQWNSNVISLWLFNTEGIISGAVKDFKVVVDGDLIGTPTVSSDGILLNGTNQYISSNFIPNTHASGQTTKLAVGAFIKENLSTANDKSLFGSVPSGGAGHIALGQYPSSAAIRSYANTNTLYDVPEGSHDDKIFDSETEYTVVQLNNVAYYYKDGILINSAARTATGLSTVEILFGATLSNVTPFRHLNARLAVGYVIDPTGFDFRGFHLGLKQMLQAIGVYSPTPELTIPTGGEWFDFSQASVGNFTSLVGRKSLLTALGVNTPTIESVNGVNMLLTASSGSKVVDLGSTFQTFYDGTLPASFSILIVVKPVSGRPVSPQAFFGHTNGTSTMYARLETDGKISIGFKEPAQAEVRTITDFPAFNETPSQPTILIFQFIKDDMIVMVNNVKVDQTKDSWGTRALTDFDAGSINMYLGCENVNGTPNNIFDGYIGDPMFRRGAWSQSQLERQFEFLG